MDAINTTGIEQRLAQMEARLRELEDRTEILQLMATYSLAMDTCDSESVAALWTEDGFYDTDGYRFASSGEVGSLTQLPEHKVLVERGCAHMIGMPRLTIDGDHAVATGYSRVYVSKGDSHEVMRASSNRWEFVRTDRGWRVASRVNRRLTGTEESRGLLSAGLKQPAE